MQIYSEQISSSKGTFHPPAYKLSLYTLKRFTMGFAAQTSHVVSKLKQRCGFWEK